MLDDVHFYCYKLCRACFSPPFKILSSFLRRGPGVLRIRHWMPVLHVLGLRQTKLRADFSVCLAHFSPLKKLKLCECEEY